MGRKIDPTFYPVIYGIADDDDWEAKKAGIRQILLLGHTIALEKGAECLSECKRKSSRRKYFSAAPIESMGKTVYQMDAYGSVG